MSFIAPQFIYGLTALAIPVIIHIFNLRKAKKVYFTKTSLLQEIKSSSKSKILLKHYLILLARLLFILFLVLAFAQPVTRKYENSLASADKVSIYLDNSYSMSRRTTSGNAAIEDALLAAEILIKKYPLETSFQLITNNFHPSSNFFFSRDELLDQLTELEYSSESRSLPDVINRIKRSEGEDIYLISDFQNNILRGNSGVDSADTYNLIPLEYSEQGNLYIDTAYLKNPFLMKGETNELEVKIRNDGKESINGLVVNFQVDSVNVGTVNTDVPGKGSSTVQFALNSSENAQQGMIEFQDFPVTFDNTFYLNLAARKEVDVAILSDSSQNPPIASIFKNESLFNISVYTAGEIDYTALTQYNLIIINELQVINDITRNALAEVCENGGSVVFIPSNSNESLMGLSLKIRSGQFIQSDLAVLDYDDPFYSNIFTEKDQRINMPSATPLFSLSGLTNQLLSFKDGNTFLGYQQIGNGRLYAFSGSIFQPFSNFLSHALCIPIFYKIAINSLGSSSDLYIRENQSALTIKKSESLEKDRVAHIVNGIDIIPEQRWVGNELKMRFQQPLHAGYFKVIFDDKDIGSFAVNISRSESMRNELNTDELIQYLAPAMVKTINYKDADTFQYSIQKNSSSGSLWKIMLLLSIFALIAEIAVIRWLKYPS